MWLLNPGGSKQEADGKVLIIPAILSLKDDVIISLHHTHSQYLRCHVWLFLISRSKGQLSRLYEDVLPAALRFPSYHKRNVKRTCSFIDANRWGCTSPAQGKVNQEWTCRFSLLVAQQPDIKLLCLTALWRKIGSWSAVPALRVSQAR